MFWNLYNGTYLGQEPISREGSDDQSSSRGARRDPRQPDPRISMPWVPQQSPDPRVTTRPEDLWPRGQQQAPDPRVTTRPEDLWPRGQRFGRRPYDDRRHPRHRYRDYRYVPNSGWWPSWFPYWDPYWRRYWQYLYGYYGGYENPEYAESARDAVLRSMARGRGWL